MRNHPLGISEKALAKDLSWPERLVLAKSCGFDFVEMSVGETDERLSRLDWSATQRASLVRAGVGSGTGRSGAGDAGGGDHGYRFYELHQQMEKVG